MGIRNDDHRLQTSDSITRRLRAEVLITILLDPATDPTADSAVDPAEWPSNPTSDSDVVNQNSHTIPKKSVLSSGRCSLSTVQ